ncbi:hypothetical protein D3C75_531250 [compost metagenome]
MLIAVSPISITSCVEAILLFLTMAEMALWFIYIPVNMAIWSATITSSRLPQNTIHRGTVTSVT